MGLLTIVIIFLLLPIVSRWVVTFLTEVQETVQQKEARREKYMNKLLFSVQKIQTKLDPPEEDPDYVGSLLDANREILEKERLNKAIENELGITTD